VLAFVPSSGTGSGYKRARPTFEFEGEVVRQMSTFVITAKQKEGVRVPDLERPEVQHALTALSWMRIDWFRRDGNRLNTPLY
jgi:hypothetical protein